MTTRILLINVHSSCNAGDAALTAVTLQQLRENFQNAKITLSMDDPDSHHGPEKVVKSPFSFVKNHQRGGRGEWKVGSLFWLLPGTLLAILTGRLTGYPFYLLTPSRWREMLAAYLQADLIVSKPGGFLYSSGRGITLLLSLYTMILALLAGKPLYIFPQSIGPLRRRWECWLLRQTLNRARLVMVREEISLEQLKTCRVDSNRCRLLPDAAFAFQAAPLEEVIAHKPELKVFLEGDQPTLGVTAINWGAQNPNFYHQETYEAAIAAGVRMFIEKYQGRALFFPQVWGPFEMQDDRISARRIAERLSDLKGAILLIQAPLPPEYLKPLYSRMDLFIGSRMHSNIFALSEGVPVIAIGYQPKTGGIMQMAGLDEWLLAIHQITAETLISRMEKLWERRLQVREQIRAKIPVFIAQAEMAGMLTADDFNQLRKEDSRE